MRVIPAILLPLTVLAAFAGWAASGVGIDPRWLYAGAKIGLGLFLVLAAGKPKPKPRPVNTEGC